MKKDRPPVKRSYDSSLRLEHARLTRRRIVEAAARLFAERGYAATSIDEIAAAAGVGRATVFGSVGGKPALLEASWDVAVVGDDEPVSLPDRPRSRAIMAEPDAHRFLSRYVELAVEIIVRTAGIVEAVRGAVGEDPAIEAVYRKIQGGRLMGAAHVVDLLRDKGGLRAGLTRDGAIDILWSLIDPALYRLFVQERSWPLDAYRTWLDETLHAQLLPARARQEEQGVCADTRC